MNGVPRPAGEPEEDGPLEVVKAKKATNHPESAVVMALRLTIERAASTVPKHP
jgi:hypothetical protein